MVGERTEQVSVKPYLYGYFVNSKFSLLVAFIVATYVTQFLLVLEGFQFLDLLSAILPIFIGIGLLTFYSDNKKCEFREGSLQFIIVSLTIAWVLLLIVFGLMGLASLAILFAGQIIILFVLLISGSLLWISASAYQYTIRSLKELSQSYTKKYISTPSFEKARSRWLAMGWIGVVAQGLMLLFADKLDTAAEEVKLIQWIDFGVFSPFLNILATVMGLALPFVLAYAFGQGKIAMAEISLEHEKEMEAAQKRAMEVIEY